MTPDEAATKRGAPLHHWVDGAWLALRTEDVLDAGGTIVDAHHHIWDRPHSTYQLPELLADLGTGHDARGTVFVECSSMYRADGDPRFASVGEVEYVNGVGAASASGRYGPVRACAGIVGKVDLTMGAFAGEVLQACRERAPERFRGIRHMAAWDASPEVSSLLRPPAPGLLRDARFREGFAQLAKLELSFDAWCLPPAVARTRRSGGCVPGGACGHQPPRRSRRPRPLRRTAGRGLPRVEGVDRRAGTAPEHRGQLGGIGMRLGGFDFHEPDLPPTSAQLAEAWQPYVHTCIDAFGPARAMFESNFPVDKGCCSYRVLWNAFKRMAAGFSEAEKSDLFAGTAIRTYRLPQTLGRASATGAQQTPS